jgi:hypothetical protein
MQDQPSHRIRGLFALACIFTLTAAVAHASETAKIPEGTEVHLHLNEPISSATAAVGDTFSISTDEEIRLADGTVIPAGYSGKGEVSAAEKNGMMGKAGQLSIRLNYIRIGDVHVHLRANKGGEGKSGVTSTIVLSVLFGPLGLLKHGHNIVFPKGQPLTAYVDEDTQIGLPVATPPKAD